MEEELKIPTNDGHLIWGTLNYCDKKSDRLIIFVHGLSDNQHHRIIFNASKFFKTRGFHTFRFSLYSENNNARILEECSIGTFVEDINSVIDYFKDDYKELYIVCHSLGFVVLDCDLSAIKSIALWDPSLSLKSERARSIRYVPNLNS